ncbi:hypothetical protein K3X48_11065 [Aliiroseovarius crassostreae]|uniref:Uncharacterized protein n=1 Tax=Aliiroseovarius crassostreae TaxID=154981 RepID=A0A9Q9H708_9RHOB|nr:hypothetical protein [Aliiroseovarius crassostreae]UWP94749.1 hypothetical protein K3X48_11065 [Aliiroseovarius crassostreae]
MTCIDSFETTKTASAGAERFIHPHVVDIAPVRFNRQVTINPEMIDEAWTNLTLNTIAQTYFERPAFLHSSFICALKSSKALRSKFG